MIETLERLANGWLGQWIDRAGFALVSSFVILTGYVQGVQTIALQVDLVVAAISIAFMEATMSVVMFCGFILFSGTVLLAKLGLAAGADPDPRTSGPTVAAIVPVYRDANVLHRSVESLLACDYEDVEVHVVTEPDDDASNQRAAAFAQRYDAVRHLVNTKYTGTKAGAINYAAEVTDTEHLAVFDADESVHPQFVPTAVAKLDDHDLVQGRTVPEPGGLIESLAYYESILLGYVSQQLLVVLTGYRVATSRAVVMRRSAFEKVGGYDTEMLTEDYEFSFRCYKERIDVVEHLRHPSRIEAAHNWTDWWGQRKRWMTGYAQTLHDQVASVRPVTDRRQLLAPLICAGSVGGNVVMLSMVPKFAVVAVLGVSWYVAVPLALIMLLAVGSRAVDVSMDAVDSNDWYWPLVPAVMVLYSFAGVKAMLEYVFTWDGSWYTVRKGI